MWDDINIPFNFQPDDKSNQQLTYHIISWTVSKMVFFCNSMTGLELLLFCGIEQQVKVTIRKEKYIWEAVWFSKERQSWWKTHPSINMLDKGNCCITVAWKPGRQEHLQSNFVQSDQKYQGHDTLLSALVVADQSVNEQAVNVHCHLSFTIQTLTKQWCIYYI